MRKPQYRVFAIIIFRIPREVQTVFVHFKVVRF